MNLPLALTQLVNEFNRAGSLHPIWPTDIIHQAAMVAEEAGEVVRAANNHKWHGKPIEEVRTELAHTGAMCIRMLMHLQKEA